VIDKALRYYLKELRTVKDLTDRGRFVSKEMVRDLGVTSMEDLHRMIHKTEQSIRDVDALRNHVDAIPSLSEDYLVEQWHKVLKELVRPISMV